MKKQKILINIASFSDSKNINPEYQDLYKDLYKKYNIKTFNFYEGSQKISDINYINKLEKKGIFLVLYNKNNIENLIKEYNNNYNIVYINTFTENLIDLVIKLNNIIGKNNPLNKEIFRNKNIQRKLIQEYNPEIGIKFLEFGIENLDLEKIEKFIGFPFILKPSSGIQSAGVSKINNKQDFEIYIKNYKKFLSNFRKRGFDNEIILAEEFIDGEMFSIDYYVDNNGEVFLSKPVEVELANVVNINDFFNFSRIVSIEVEKKLEKYDLTGFIKETINTTKIRNFFVHHEFKLTTKGKLKTIELNGRIGGYRPGLYYRGYGLNLFKLLLGKQEQINLEKNSAVITIYSEKKGILKGFNKEIWQKIEKLNSIYSVKKLKNFIGKEVGLTKDGFGKIAIIKLQNNNLEKFSEDINFIKQNYFKLLDVK